MTSQQTAYLVKRLHQGTDGYPISSIVLREAADAIEALTAANAEMREALAECVAELEGMGVSEAMTFMEQARAALARKP